jgi:hypothetical protein
MNTTILLKANLLTAPEAPARLRRPAQPARQNQVQLRAYRRALRAAEQAAWEAGEPRPAVSTLPSPIAESDRPLNLLFSLIALASVMALVFGANSVAQFTAHWDRFVEFVRLAVG